MKPFPGDRRCPQGTYPEQEDNMTFKPIALTTTAALAISGCADMTRQQQDQAAAGAIGATAGVIGAKILGADSGWTAVGALAGAAAGALIARNQQTGQCAYADGQGGYYTAPC
jgi:uncharacterized protein YcfJ